MNGNPKSLNEAIRNGIDEIMKIDNPTNKALLSQMIEAHVKDFLAQRFGTEMLQVDDKSMKMLYRLCDALDMKYQTTIDKS